MLKKPLFGNLAKLLHMLKLGATIVHRITDKEYKIVGFYYQNNRKGFLAAITQERALNAPKEIRENCVVEFSDGTYDTYDNVNSSLYITKEEYKAMIKFVVGVDPYCDDPTVIIFDKQSGRVYKKDDFVPNPG